MTLRKIDDTQIIKQQDAVIRAYAKEVEKLKLELEKLRLMYARTLGVSK